MFPLLLVKHFLKVRYTTVINLRFSLSLPSKTIPIHKDYFYKNGHFFGHKNWDLQISKMGNQLIGFEFSFHPSCRDHAGLKIEFALFKHVIILDISDNRHWNYDEGRWCLPEEY